MNNLLLKKNQLLYKITSFILILSSLSTLPVSALESPDHNISNIQEDFTDVSSDTDTNDELKQQFQPLIENIFLNRNSAILTRDCEGLKVFYDLNKNGLMKMKLLKQNTLLIGVKNNVFHLQK